MNNLIRMKYQDLSLFEMPKSFRGKPSWYVQLWWLVDSIFIQPSPQILYGWRRFWYRAFGAKIGKKVIIRPSVKMTYPWKVSIGDYSWIGDDVSLYSLGTITIGNHVVVSQKSYLCTGSHDYKKVAFDITNSPIVIEDEAWIASDVFVGPGVTIGKGCLIGARSSVFTSVEGGFIYLGNPLKKIKER